MSVFCLQSEQRVETARLPGAVSPEVLSNLEGRAKMPREVLEDGSAGRILIENEGDLFPAAEEIANAADGNATDVAAFLLSTVCGWRSKAIQHALKQGDPRTAQAAIRRGGTLVREGTTRV